MVTEIPLQSIDSNPYNSRSSSNPSRIQELVRSLSQNGQLVPIRVRHNRRAPGKYELVYGHRRLEAAKRLKWKSIRAEIVSASNEELMVQSLVENLHREDLSDFEKALIFERMNSEFGWTYECIAKNVGISPQHVSNHIAMLRLFDSSVMACNPDLRVILNSISEHHARLLSRVADPSARVDLARMIVREHLTVKELTNIIGRLRSWFETKNGDDDQASTDKQTSLRESSTKNRWHHAAKLEEDRIAKVIYDKLGIQAESDYAHFEKLHMFNSGFSLFSSTPPLNRLEGELALSKERNWFYKIAPKISTYIDEMKIDNLGDTALIALVGHIVQGGSARKRVSYRGTIVLVKRGKTWRILHEHYSNIAEDNFQVNPLQQAPGNR